MKSLDLKTGEMTFRKFEWSGEFELNIHNIEPKELLQVALIYDLEVKVLKSELSNNYFYTTSFRDNRIDLYSTHFDVEP